MKRAERDWESHLTETPLGTGGFSMGTIRKVKERIAVQERRKKKKIVPLAAAALVAVILAAVVFRSEIGSTLASWNKPEPEKKPVISETETTTLKIGYLSGADDFMRKYGSPFVIRHPMARFSYSANVPKMGSLEDYREWIENEEPDLVQIPLGYLDELSSAGLLTDLDALLLRDGIDEQNFYEPVRRTIREAGAGKLYGMADKFSAYGLYYNRELFAEFGIPEPSGSLTWEETMGLAARFAGSEKNGDPVYGLSFGYRPGLSLNAVTVGQSLGLGTYAPDGLRSTLSSKAWTGLWSSFVQGYRDGWIGGEQGMEQGKSYPMKELYKLDPFLNGRSAMTFQPSDYGSNLAGAREMIGFDDEWALLPAPALDESARSGGQAMEIGYVFAIPSRSSQPDAAWELLKYILSPEQTERQTRTVPYTLYTVKAETVDAFGPQDAYYEARYDTSLSLSSLKQKADPAYQALLNLAYKSGQERERDLLNGSLGVEPFLKQLDNEAEETLRTLAAEKEARP
jgi:ABC-type sugar transport system, periplasmic component